VSDLVDTLAADERLDGWMVWPLSEAVVRRALADGSLSAFDDAHRLLAVLTGRLTGEFALRDLLLADHVRSLAIAREWTASPDEHVRRLASEGTRPRLPWARRVPALLETAGLTRPVIDRLRDDPSASVARSAGNHLNDISRDHPATAVAIARGWAGAGGVTPTLRRGLRTLIKQGHEEALALLGFSGDDLLVGAPVVRASTVTIGDSLPFSVTLENRSEREARAVIDYVLLSPRSNGTSSERVFKLAVRTIHPGGSVTVEGKRNVVPLSTRTVRPGRHALIAQANGRRSPATTFDVREP
jgi:3-methyladenine DNA glycosylase AlkC